MDAPKQSEFEQAATRQAHSSLLGEVWGFAKQNKKWWLLPLVVTLLLFGLLVLLGGTSLAPFIYTLF